jgi:K+-transporting ATPase ATPase C chain
VRRQLRPAIVVVVLLTLLTGVAYPLVVTGVSQVAFGHAANGSLVEVDGRAVGSELIGQQFVGERYFWPRPSAAGDGYDAMASGGSNLGPTSEALLAECLPIPVVDDDDDGDEAVDDHGDPVVELDERGGVVCDPDTVPRRAAAYREANGLDDAAEVPVDAVTSSGSGLDPHISVANARLQAGRVAEARGLPPEQVLALIGRSTDPAPLGVLGVDGVNVLRLNLALDALA